ncbi:MAG TPA: SAM-dependent methyltransferase, partial [Nitrospirae bacterium]|nr:SAM-dependent methyltransferase [Nitrospirota bacterium]
MPLDINPSRKHLKEFNFEPLFIEELGWDHYDKELVVSFAGKSFTLSAIAEKRGMAAFRCPAPPDGRIPDYATRRKIEKQTAKSAHEHIIVYTDPEKSTQIWQWVKRESGKPAACREHAYHKNQPGDSLLQKLRNIAFTIEDEESLTLPQVTGRARAAFDVEKVTKKFYDRFKKEHDAFFDFIAGIPDDDLHTWYASVMLNRIMFIYFVQKKGFLDGDPDYLRKRLEQSMKQGKDLFYKKFLSPLFFEGFAKKEDDRSAKMNRLLGEVPYLNGGLFLKHQIEELHGKDIQITDNAFEKLFDFFDQYQWHLDERLSRSDNEINPDVLGYIFEKYINQKQMGAYYTKEDITEYISKNTVIPFLFDEAKKKCKIAFEGEQSVWNLLKSDPDRYIYDAVKHGITVNIHEHPPKPLEKPLDLPEDIAVGIKDVSKRTEWNRPAPAEYALPTEIWREVVARRQRYEEVRAKMEKSEIESINDLITYNLDIRQFAQDVIWNSEGPELLRAFYHAIEKVTVLDPTCGSGAFLFAALNILEPLYEACLDRMQIFVNEVGAIHELPLHGQKYRSDKYGDFKKNLIRVEKHQNFKYFIYKSIIVNNLYGVDIMEEAIEICKLRLFLKLVAQIDNVKQIEPLPDIDFNIRAGN